MRATTLMAAAGALLLMLAPSPVAASEELAEVEGQQCTACHDKPGSKLLTGKGKYYEVMRTLDGYDAVTRIFGECTSCHKKKPGSMKLTATGREFAELIGDMEGLKALLLMEHPTPPPEAARFGSEVGMAPAIPAVESEVSEAVTNGQEEKEESTETREEEENE